MAKIYKVAVLVTVEATTYEEAVNKVVVLASELGTDHNYPNFFFDAVTDYEHDNGDTEEYGSPGQRVLYLHPETRPRNEHGNVVQD